MRDSPLDLIGEGEDGVDSGVLDAPALIDLNVHEIELPDLHNESGMAGKLRFTSRTATTASHAARGAAG